MCEGKRLVAPESSYNTPCHILEADQTPSLSLAALETREWNIRNAKAIQAETVIRYGQSQQQRRQYLLFYGGVLPPQLGKKCKKNGRIYLHHVLRHAHLLSHPRYVKGGQGLLELLDSFHRIHLFYRDVSRGRQQTGEGEERKYNKQLKFGGARTKLMRSRTR